MTISLDLLKILCCPETKEGLFIANDDELKKINLLIDQKKIFNCEGKLISTPLGSALIREDKKIAYRIQDNIPILLIHEGIQIP